MSERIHNVTRAICRQTDGSRTDGKKVVRLFLTDYCKALSRAPMCDYDFHIAEIVKSESKERLVIECSIRLDKNRTPIQNESNVLLYLEHESLPSLDLNHNHVGEYMN